MADGWTDGRRRRAAMRGRPESAPCYGPCVACMLTRTCIVAVLYAFHRMCRAHPSDTIRTTRRPDAQEALTPDEVAMVTTVSAALFEGFRMSLDWVRASIKSARGMVGSRRSIKEAARQMLVI